VVLVSRSLKITVWYVRNGGRETLAASVQRSDLKLRRFRVRKRECYRLVYVGGPSLLGCSRYVCPAMCNPRLKTVPHICSDVERVTNGIEYVSAGCCR
jgi:hypothetical protein